MGIASVAISEKAGPVKRKRVVEVVAASSAFPISTKPKRQSRQSSFAAERLEEQKQKEKNSKILDWHDTVKEVRNFGATAFVGKQKRNHEAEEYKRLTGREKKGQRIPLPIVRGIQKKAAQREAKVLEEAKAAGIVLPAAAASKSKKEKDKNKINEGHSSRHGPTPSIGHVNKGVLTVKRKPM
ncbi:hypothetical protein MPSEU_000239100 [Mayamaea pseudoterrestris]|nr:hypothetical protein MPSEU_000239100 [Mayamaea pseudoterrestris]